MKYEVKKHVSWEELWNCNVHSKCFMNEFANAMKVFCPVTMHAVIPKPANAPKMQENWIDFLVQRGIWERVEEKTYKVGDKFQVKDALEGVFTFLAKYVYMLAHVGPNKVKVLRSDGTGALRWETTRVDNVERITESEMEKIFPTGDTSRWSEKWKKIN